MGATTSKLLEMMTKLPLRFEVLVLRIGEGRWKVCHGVEYLQKRTTDVYFVDCGALAGHWPHAL